MLGLFHKRDVDTQVIEKEYGSEMEKLLALLEYDLKLINEQKKEMKEAVRALRGSKGYTLEKDHINTIRLRLDTIHRNLLLTNKQAGEATSHHPVEATTLQNLNNLVEQIFKLLSNR